MFSVSRFVIGKEVFIPSVSSKASLNESNKTIQFNQHMTLPYVELDRVIKGEYIVVQAEINVDDKKSKITSVAVKIVEFAKLLNVKVEKFERLCKSSQLVYRLNSVGQTKKHVKVANKENINTLNLPKSSNTPSLISKTPVSADTKEASALDEESTFASYPQEFANAVRLIRLIPEGREAISKAQKNGKIKISLVNKNPLIPVAWWDPATREICLDGYQNSTLDRQIMNIIFEVFNAQKEVAFAEVEKLGITRKINIMTCAIRMEILEYTTYLETKKLIKIGRDDWGLFPDMEMEKYDNLSHFLKVQEKRGHTKMYIDDLMRIFLNKKNN